jgi:hypothetical protein
MSDEPIHRHIEAANSRSQRETRRLTLGILSTCWPGGSQDRTEPAALDWLRLWRPGRSNAITPACSCAHGHCAVCN